jgi:small basic protein
MTPPLDQPGESHGSHGPPGAADHSRMPSPTAAPIVLSTGLALAAAGLATNYSLSVVGVVVAAIGIAMWLAELLPGRGHVAMGAVEPVFQPTPIVARPGTVETLVAGRPGYRMRMPEQVHPLSAGIKGGIVGGLVMPVPALGYGVLSGHGLWYPVNLLAGMVLPGVGTMSPEQLQQFQLSLVLIAVVIHVTMSLMLGLIYGVLLPTLPDIPQPLAWGGLLMPLLWTAASYNLMGAVNPALREGVDWLWFIVSQFVFGVVLAACIMRLRRMPLPLAGLLGGLVGGALMAVPAIAWSVANGHGIWYPVNLLAAMALESMHGRMPEELTQFHAVWFAWAVAIHAVMSGIFGLAYGLLLPLLPRMPGPLAWGGLVMPLLWTGMSFGLMGVVNPVLQHLVDWPWFIVSQFIFGIVAAIVVVRSELVHIPPAGAGPDDLSTFVEGGP